MIEPILQYRPTVSDVDISAVTDYLKSGGFITEFKKCREFEQALADYISISYAHLFPNGTLTLYSALQVLELPPNSKVLVPNYTMAATAMAPVAAGFDVVFCDIELPSLCLDFDSIRSLVESHSDIQAVILVSANGRYPSYPVKQLSDYLTERGIHLIEDAAQSLGSLCPYTGKHVGSYGSFSSFSFSMPKIITTGQGGVLLTNDPTLSDKIKHFRDFGRDSSGGDYHSQLGLNFKFTDMQAALGLSQLSTLKSRIDSKKASFKYLFDRVSSPFLSLNPNNLNFTTPWFFEVITPHRSELIDYLRSKKISSRVMYPELNKQQCFSKHDQSHHNFTNSQFISQQGLWLPSYSHLSIIELCYISKALNDFVPG